MGATPPPPRLYSLRLLIVKRPKSGTAKTVTAVPAAPALDRGGREGDFLSLFLLFCFLVAAVVVVVSVCTGWGVMANIMHKSHC